MLVNEKTTENANLTSDTTSEEVDNTLINITYAVLRV